VSRRIIKTLSPLYANRAWNRKVIRMQNRTHVDGPKMSVVGYKSTDSIDRVAIHQLLSIILKLSILVLLSVSNLHYVVQVKNYS
jgi:hypothetical protein